MDRRNFLKASAAGAALGLTGCGSIKKNPHVVVVGAGFGGATAAKYLRLWSQGDVDVTLIERGSSFISCPISNLVLAGTKTLADVTLGYEGLRKQGVRLVQGEVAGIDPDKRRVHLNDGSSIGYDRLVLSPGVDFIYDGVPGLRRELSDTQFLHAWKAGPQTVALRRQLEAMPNGGVYALTIPKAPYRCPPGPYERASVIAHYFKQHKPKSKVLILDANEDVVSKKGLFTKIWNDNYKGILEYRKEHTITSLDAATRTLRFDFGDPVKADVLNIVPPQRAGALATPLVNKNGRWVGVDWLSMESETTRGIHVLGDATFAAPGMPKSGHMANQHGKVAAAAILNLLAGEAPNPEPMMTNTCYSFVDDRNAIHVASVHAYDAKEKTLKPVAGAGGVSTQGNEQEGRFALDWARNIWADTLT